jgi:hypothetical protein
LLDTVALNGNQAAPWEDLLQAINGLREDVTALRGEVRREVRNMAARSFNSSAVGDDSLRSLSNNADAHHDDFPGSLTEFHALDHPALDGLLAHYELDAIAEATDDAKAQKKRALGYFIGVRI